MPGYQPRHDTDPVWFNGTQVNNLTVTSDHTGVLITAVHGWDDRPDVRDVRSNRSGQDGEYADNLYIGGRTITIEGEVYGSTWANLQSRKRTLAALFIPTSTEVLLKIPDPSTASPTAVYTSTGMTGYERSSVRVVEAIRFGETRDPRCQVFQVVVRASDPRVYSDTATSTDSGTSGTASRTVTVDQGGSYETPETVTVTGPTASEFAVADPTSGLSLAFSGLTLAATEAVAIDVRDRTVDLTSTVRGYRDRISTLICGFLLDETTGTNADNYDGASALDLTYTGGFTLNQSGPAAGIAAVTLNGSSGYLNGAYNAALAVNSFTFEAWIKPTSVAGTMYIAVRGNVSGGSGGWYLRTIGTRLDCTVDLPTDSGAASPVGTLTSGSWTHVVFTYDDATKTCRLYANGVDVSSSPSIGSGTYTPNTTHGLRLGALNSSASNYFTGSIGPCAMFSAAMSPVAVADLYTTALAATTESNAYSYLVASSTRWANLGTESSTYTLASSGLGTGSKLNVTYRDARL